MESSEFKHCIEKNGLKKIVPDNALSELELNEASSDLKLARSSLASNACGWAVVQCYYACFHATKALVISKGFTEKSHRCLSIALRDLLERDKLMKEGSTAFLDELRELREEFNYALKQISEEETAEIIQNSEDFISEAKRLLAKK